MSRGSTPRHAQTAGDLGFAVQFNSETPWHDFYGHPTSISGHNIIGFIAVWYIDITEDIAAFVLDKITSCAKRVNILFNYLGVF